MYNVSGDKMYRNILIIVPLLILIFLTGCLQTKNNIDTVDHSITIVIPPDNETSYNINGYKDTTQIADEGLYDYYDGIFFGNKNTKKYHKETCRYAKSMDESKMVFFDSSNEAKLMGYSPCSVCNK